MPKKILVVDDEETIRETLTEVLREEGYVVSMAVDGNDAINQIKQNNFDLVLSDVVMPGCDGLAVLNAVRKWRPSALVALMTAFGTVNNAVDAMKLGAVDYITKPFVFNDIILTLKRVFDEQRQVRIDLSLEEEIKKKQRYGLIIGATSLMASVFALIEKVAPTNSNVLVTGKSGTGKELVARTLHEKSARADKTFLPINCAAIPGELIESEMFGFMKGAFTGANQTREGFFKISEGGTLFLDEISSVPLQLQAKLLRVIETKEIIPVGGSGVEKVDIRIIAATNKNLYNEVANDRFREDLYYRLKVFEICLPPLRDRRQDIPLLTRHFIKKFNTKFNKNVKGLESPVMGRFFNHEWKGNVRELENELERAMIMCEQEFISEKDLSLGFSQTPKSEETCSLKEAVSRFEKDQIINALRIMGNDKKKAAWLLGLSPSSLYRKIEELEIS